MLHLTLANKKNVVAQTRVARIVKTFQANRISGTIIITGQRVTAVLDTAAIISFLAETFGQQFKQKYRRTTHLANVFLAYETQLKINSTFTCHLQFENRRTLVHFVVMLEAKEPSLLGYNFLRHSELRWYVLENLHIVDQEAH
uniref:RVP domain-containing protein n=1 Tax=Glossina austeni TaxID=7395 RepID=A0A1A9UX13_GLOAU